MQRKAFSRQLSVMGLVCLALAAPVVKAAGDGGERCAALQASAEQGQPESQYALGTLYQQGQDCPHDLVMAYFWLEAASRVGYGPAFPVRDAVAESLDNQTVVRVSTIAEQWAECRRTQGVCDQPARLQAAVITESLGHFQQ